MPPVSRRLSAHRHSLLGHPVPAEGSTFLTVSPPRRKPARTPVGVSTFHTSETQPGWAPSKPRGRWYPPGRRFSCPAGTRRFATAVPKPRWSLPPARLERDEASSRVHSRSPVRFSPCLWPADGTPALGLLPRASHPAVTSDARQGGGRPWTLARTIPSTSAEPPIGAATQLVRPRVAPSRRYPGAAGPRPARRSRPGRGRGTPTAGGTRTRV